VLLKLTTSNPNVYYLVLATLSSIQMPEIRDPIHSDIFLDDSEIAVIDTPEFQRLRWLAELPTARFVYPGATHSRFSHCVGVMMLANTIYRNLKRADGRQFKPNANLLKHLRVAALLHDIDTPPYYPIFLDHYLVKDYLMAIKRECVRSICKGVNNESDDEDEKIDPDIVLSILEGRDEFKYLSQIIDCEVGANRLDYLMRDAYYCGVNYGRLDPRILYQFYFDSEQIVLKKEALPLVDTVFNAMFQMKINVYDHRIARLAARMLYIAVDEGIKKRSHRIPDLLRMTDEEFLREVGKADVESVERIRRRTFPKTAFILDAVSLRDMELIPRYFESFRQSKEVIERELKSITNSESVVVDFVSLKQPPATPIKAQVNSTQIVLSEVPLLSKWYERQPFEQWKMFVFCDAIDLRAVHDACEKILGPLEIGRESEERKVIEPLRDLYAQLDGRVSSDRVHSSMKEKILDLPRHELSTLRALVAMGPSTAVDTSKHTQRERSTASLILNRLVEYGFVEKERLGKRVFFKPTSATISAIRELGTTPLLKPVVKV